MYSVLIGTPKKMRVIYEAETLIEATGFAIDYIEAINEGIRRVGSHGQLVTDGKGLFKDKLYVVEDSFPIHHFWVIDITEDNAVRARLET